MKLAKIDARLAVRAYRLAFDDEMKSFVYIHRANFRVRARVYIKVSMQRRSKYRNVHYGKRIIRFRQNL